MATNYSLYSIPAFYLLALGPTVYGGAVVARSRNKQPYDIVNPRGTARIESLKKTCPKDVFEAYERSRAAHYNSLENLPLFASAIICGNMARLDPQTLNLWSATFLGLRTAYIIVYLGATTPSIAALRSSCWVASVGVCCYLFYLAGGIMANGGPLAV